MAAYIETALNEQEQGTSLPFAIVEKATGARSGAPVSAISTARIIAWRSAGRGWRGEWQRTAMNTEAKYLLLKARFRNAGMHARGAKNGFAERTLAPAILRIGAREEGIFRNHMITASGRNPAHGLFQHYRFEWPAVKARLEAKAEFPASTRATRTRVMPCLLRNDRPFG